MGHYIKVKELPPVIQRGLEEVGYARPDIEVNVQDRVCIRPPSGKGKRGFCIACVLDDSETYKITWGSWGGSNMFTRTVDDVDEVVDTPPNSAFIMGSKFGGQPTYASMVISPMNMNPRLLPPVVDVTEKEKKILAVFKMLKSFARPEYLSRMHATSDEVDSLVERGFLKRNKAGATQITTEGRNAAGRNYY